MPHDDNSSELAPPIAAVFLVVFDKKVGYKIAWERSLPEIQLKGVDYKSLPSGLHNVERDLVYFTHGEHAGISAFRNQPADEADRNAQFLAVGVLVPLSYGRLGRSWMHAQGLRDLAEKCATSGAPSEQSDLQQYWQAHKLNTASDELQASALAEPSSPQGVRAVDAKSKKRRSRALSDAAGFSLRDHLLSPDHPALSMPAFLETFGPLVFPLYRATLLRKRVLFLGSAPIQRSCNFVYDLSIFSNIPPSLADTLSSSPSMNRIRPLFNVGIHDIPELSAKDHQDATASGEGWIACTTDDILSTKTALYDVLVSLPPNSSPDQWPTLTTSSGAPIKATQRDLRRYNAIRRELSRLRSRPAYTDSPAAPASPLDDDDDDINPLMHSLTSLVPPDHAPPPIDNEAAIIEPPSWASIAYSSFLWWASAGERSTAQDDEVGQDAALLEDLVSTTSAPTTPLPAGVRGRRGSGRRKGASRTSLVGMAEEDGEEPEAEKDVRGTQQIAMVLIAYFRRLTALMMEGLGDVIDSEEDEEEDGEGERDAVIELTADEMRRMGLDVWSEADARFVADLGWVWWGRDVRWNGRGVECCGVRIC